MSSSIKVQDSVNSQTANIEFVVKINNETLIAFRKIFKKFKNKLNNKVNIIHLEKIHHIRKKFVVVDHCLHLFFS